MIAAMRLLLILAAGLILMIPLPGGVVDTVTGPLKHWISVIVVGLLALFGYPISTTGIVLSIGQYQMLVADASSGLHSMLSLSALGMLVMCIKGRKSFLHNAIMLAGVLPIAFAANVMRVIVLVLTTYHFGDESAMSFLHGMSSTLQMLVALLLFFALDSLLERVLRPRGLPPPMPANASS